MSGRASDLAVRARWRPASRLALLPAVHAVVCRVFQHFTADVVASAGAPLALRSDGSERRHERLLASAARADTKDGAAKEKRNG
jgi:hypothetical protein